MADGGNDGEAYSVAVQGSPGGASSHTAAAACRRMKCDRLGAVDRTPRELLTDGGGELTAEVHVLIGPAALLAFPASGAQVGVGETLPRRLFDRRRFRQNPLPLIAIASFAPAHHDGGQSAGLRGAPGERGIAGRQKLEVAEVGAVQTQCTRLVHAKEVAGVAAGRARPRVVRRDHDDPLGTAWWALVVVFFSVAGAAAAMYLQRYFIIVGTAFGGAWTMIVGAMALIGDRAAMTAAASGDVWVAYPLNPAPGIP